MVTKDDLESMVKYLEDKIEDMAGIIFDQKLEIAVLEGEIRQLEKELRYVQ